MIIATTFTFIIGLMLYLVVGAISTAAVGFLVNGRKFAEPPRPNDEFGFGGIGFLVVAWPVWLFVATPLIFLWFVGKSFAWIVVTLMEKYDRG